jgi:hypothetical protein
LSSALQIVVDFYRPILLLGRYLADDLRTLKKAAVLLLELTSYKPKNSFLIHAKLTCVSLQAAAVFACPIPLFQSTFLWVSVPVLLGFFSFHKSILLVIAATLL